MVTKVNWLQTNFGCNDNEYECRMAENFAFARIIWKNYFDAEIKVALLPKKCKKIN